MVGKNMFKTFKVGELIFGMANLRSRTTGLPMVIWVSEKGNSRHAARIKVSLKHGDKIVPSKTVTVTIEDNPRQIGKDQLDDSDFILVVDFIQRHKKTLMDYWNRKIDTDILIDSLKKN